MFDHAMSRCGTRIFAVLLLTTAVIGTGTATHAAPWGPPVGAPLPLLEAPDHTGRIRNLENLRGPHGLLLFMNRSTDW